jgi:hypothetical protein
VYCVVVGLCQVCVQQSLGNLDYMVGRGGPDYPGIRFTEQKIRGVGNVQKVMTQS